MGKMWASIGTWFGLKTEHEIDVEAHIAQTIKQEADRHREVSINAGRIIDYAAGLRKDYNQLVYAISNLEDRIKLINKCKFGGSENPELRKSALQLVKLEVQRDEIELTLAAANQSAKQAQKLLDESQQRLKTIVDEQKLLLAQLSQAKMQEETARSLKALSSSVNSLGLSNSQADKVREAIERRYAVALANTEMYSGVRDRKQELEDAWIARRAEAKLQQINQLESEIDEHGQKINAIEKVVS